MHTFLAIYLVGAGIAFVALALNQIRLIGDARVPVHWALALWIFWPVFAVIVPAFMVWSALFARDWSR